MSEQIQVKRSLLRLHQATVAEISDHSGVKLATVKSFLHDHPDLVEPVVEQTTSGSGRRRGRPATVWRLKPAGKEFIVMEMDRLNKNSNINAEEKTSSDMAIRDSIKYLHATVDNLKRNMYDIKNSEFEANRKRLQRRADVTRVALGDLLTTNHSLTAELYLLEKLINDLADLDPIFLSDEALPPLKSMAELFDNVQVVVGRYVSDWFTGLRHDVEHFITPESCVIPDHPGVAPIVFLDGIREANTLSQSVVEKCNMSGAPVLHLSIGRMKAEKRAPLLELIAHRLTFAAGAAAQVVFTIDGSRPEASELARDFAGMERTRSFRRFSSSQLIDEPYAKALVPLTSVIACGAGLFLGSGFSGGSVLAGQLLIAGRLFEKVSRSHGYGKGSAEPSIGNFHVRSLCLDASIDQNLSHFFKDSGVGYVAGQVQATELPNPLSLRSDIVTKSTNNLKWDIGFPNSKNIDNSYFDHARKHKDLPSIFIIEPRQFIRECLYNSIVEAMPDYHISTFASLDDWDSKKIDHPEDSLVILYYDPSENRRTNARLEDPIYSWIGLKYKLVLLSDSEDPIDIVERLNAGARGYIPTNLSLRTVIDAIRLVLAGGVFVPPSCLQKRQDRSKEDNTTDPRSQFTPRQMAVLEQLQKGKSNKIIAFELNMKESTVKVYVRNIMRKVGATNRSEVAIRAFEARSDNKNNR